MLYIQTPRLLMLVAARDMVDVIAEVVVVTTSESTDLGVGWSRMGCDSYPNVSPFHLPCPPSFAPPPFLHILLVTASAKFGSTCETLRYLPRVTI